MMNFSVTPAVSRIDFTPHHLFFPVPIKIVFIALAVFALALAMVGSVSAQDTDSFILPTGETQDECASRLDGDIRISTYADALLWIQQFERECTMPTLGEGETRLTHEEVHVDD